MPNAGKNRVVFLLGAGASIPAGMPSTPRITDEVLNCNDVIQHTDGRYYFGIGDRYPAEVRDERPEKIKEFLVLLKEELRSYCNEQSHLLNYEHLFDAVHQISESLADEFANLPVKPFVNKVGPLLDRFRERKSWGEKMVDTPIEFIDEVLNYIRAVVHNLLRLPHVEISEPKVVLEACRDGSLDSLDLITVNHDLVIEKLMKGNGISYVDGFDDSVKNLRCWLPRLYRSKTARIRLFKLHGSVDWEYLRSDRDFLAIPEFDDAKRATDRRGRQLWPLLPRPYILIGVNNKITDYTSGVFADLQEFFHESLRSNDNLIICGYGFGDEGINRKIFEYCESVDNKSVIIDPAPTSLMNDPRFHRCRRASIIEKGIEDTTWEEVKESLEL